MKSQAINRLLKWGLQPIKLRDKQMFYQYTKLCDYPANLWSSNFAYLWADSKANGKQVYWKIVNGMLVPFVYYRGLGLHLVCLPMGQGSPSKVLYTCYLCLLFCNKWNKSTGYGKAAIRSINANQYDFLMLSPYFKQYFELQRIKGLERHFSIIKLCEHTGKPFKDVRYAINKFNRSFPNAVIRRYNDEDYEELLQVNANWVKTAGVKYSHIFDQIYFKEIAKNHIKLDHIIVVVEIDGKIVGVVTGGITPQHQSWGCFIKKMRDIQGLNEVMIVAFAKEIHRLYPSVELLNVGSDLGEKGLIDFKEKFQPVLSLEKFRVTLK